MASAKSVTDRIERQRDTCHALLERKGKLERKHAPLKAKMVLLNADIVACQARVRAMRAAGEDLSKVERVRDRCAALLARIEKIERKADPLAEKIAALHTKYGEERTKLQAMGA